MCGRYSVIPKKGASKAAKLLEKQHAEARYNAAPSQALPVITNEQPDELQYFKWGLLPHWAKEKNFKQKAVNARAESLVEKPFFRQLVQRKRCLVPADSFYEWRHLSKGKQPYRILLKSEELFCFAGLWDEWADQETGEVLHTYTIITTDSNKLIQPLHDRMPVLLHPSEEELWLADDATEKEHLQLLRPYPAEEMKLYAVSALLNSPQHDSPEVIRPEIGGLFG